MHQIGSDRAISTVLDVALALLFITASVMAVGYYIGSVADDSAGVETERGAIVTDGDHDALSATQLAETMSESTIAVTYDLSDVRDEDEFSEPVITDKTTYTRTDYGSALGLVADAAIVNHQIDGDPVVGYGEEYEAAVDWAIRHRLLGTERNFYVVAEWSPYEGASISGTATAGERPPATADVSSTTTTVSSGIPAVDEDELESDWLDADAELEALLDELPGNQTLSDVPGLEGSDEQSYAVAGTAIGEAVVDGLFPTEQSQYALEDQGIERALTVYRYKSMVETIGGFSFRSADTHPPLVRTEARAEQANRNVLVGHEGGYQFTDADALAAWIAADIPQAFDEEFAAIDKAYNGDERDEQKVETVIEALSTEEVTITVQTWTD